MRDRILAAWDAAVLAEQLSGGEAPDVVVAAGSVLREPASELAVVGLEARLGVQLPPSYRRFLLASDGALAQPGWGFVGDSTGELELGLLDCTQVGWLRDRDRVTIDIWTENGGDEDGVRHPCFQAWCSEDEYLAHAPGDENMKSGHLLYALQIASDVDGYTVLLNPLVVDQHGEWEAWDFGAKNPGALRFRSFAALLEYDTADRARRALEDEAQRRDPASLLTEAEDVSLPAEQRLHACRQLVYSGEPSLAVPTLAAFAIGLDHPLGHQAAELLAQRSTIAAAGAALRALAADPGLPAPLYEPVINGLAHSGDADDEAAAVELLARPRVRDAVRHLWPASGDVAWAAWQRTADPRLLEHAAWSRRAEVGAPMAEVISDRSQPAQLREKLVRQAYLTGDRGLVPALAECAGFGDVRADAVANALKRLGAHREAVDALSQGVRTGEAFPGQASRPLGWLDEDPAGQATLELFAARPSAPLAIALGWHPVPGAVQALKRAAVDPELAQSAIDGLERIRGRDATDALADLAEAGDLLAVGALARRRDTRALEPLTDLLIDPDPARALAGADGLRDLRDPAAAGALLDLVTHSDAAVAAVAAHALVTLAAAQLPLALAELRARPEPTLRNLATRWSD